jgi:hypothetical protein
VDAEQRGLRSPGTAGGDAPPGPRVPAPSKYRRHRKGGRECRPRLGAFPDEAIRFSSGWSRSTGGSQVARSGFPTDFHVVGCCRSC